MYETTIPTMYINYDSCTRYRSKYRNRRRSSGSSSEGDKGGEDDVERDNNGAEKTVEPENKKGSLI